MWNATVLNVLDFYKFVRPIHKCQFDEKCRELTGQGCGYNPRDEQRFKRSIITSGNHHYVTLII